MQKSNKLEPIWCPPWNRYLFSIRNYGFLCFVKCFLQFIFPFCSQGTKFWMFNPATNSTKVTDVDAQIMWLSPTGEWWFVHTADAMTHILHSRRLVDQSFMAIGRASRFPNARSKTTQAKWHMTGWNRTADTLLNTCTFMNDLMRLLNVSICKAVATSSVGKSVIARIICKMILCCEGKLIRWKINKLQTPRKKIKSMCSHLSVSQSNSYNPVIQA